MRKILLPLAAAALSVIAKPTFAEAPTDDPAIAETTAATHEAIQTPHVRHVKIESTETNERGTLIELKDGRKIYVGADGITAGDIFDINNKSSEGLFTGFLKSDAPLLQSLETTEGGSWRLPTRADLPLLQAIATTQPDVFSDGVGGPGLNFWTSETANPNAYFYDLQLYTLRPADGTATPYLMDSAINVALIRDNPVPPPTETASKTPNIKNVQETSNGKEVELQDGRKILIPKNDRDYDGTTYDEAVATLTKAGSAWRLPKREDLELISTLLEEHPKLFPRDFYWTGERNDSSRVFGGAGYTYFVINPVQKKTTELVTDSLAATILIQDIPDH